MRCCMGAAVSSATIALVTDARAFGILERTAARAVASAAGTWGTQFRAKARQAAASGWLSTKWATSRSEVAATTAKGTITLPTDTASIARRSACTGEGASGRSRAHWHSVAEATGCCCHLLRHKTPHIDSSGATAALERGDGQEGKDDDDRWRGGLCVQSGNVELAHAVPSTLQNRRRGTYNGAHVDTGHRSCATSALVHSKRRVTAVSSSGSCSGDHHGSHTGHELQRRLLEQLALGGGRRRRWWRRRLGLAPLGRPFARSCQQRHAEQRCQRDGCPRDGPPSRHGAGEGGIRCHVTRFESQALHLRVGGLVCEETARTGA